MPTTNADGPGSSSDSEPTAGSGESTGAFVPTAGDSSTTDVDLCEPGTLDCDDRPGCESSSEAPETCGSCDKSCVVSGVTLSCSDGMCSGDVAFTEAEDGHTDQFWPGESYYGASYLRLRGDAGAHQRAYLRFAGVSEIPQNAEIIAATLVLHRLASVFNSQPLTVGLVEGDWEEESLAWFTQPATQAPFVTVMSDEPSPLEFDVVPALQAWVTGMPNDGVMVAALLGPGGSGDWLSFYASESTEFRPSLEVSLS